MMLPTTSDNGVSRQATASQLHPLAMPLGQAGVRLLSPTSALRSQEMDGMADMLSSDHQSLTNSQPAAAELETEVRARALTRGRQGHHAVEGARV
jgi:hypothetical protein